MIWPLLPLLLTQSMHASVAYVGVIEGCAEAVAAAGKYLVGRRSDKIKKRRPYVLMGYTLSTLARPLLALASLPVHALAVRLLDRVGKGLRSSPRDALIAEVTPGAQRTVAFGFHRAMDNLGAVIGPLLALAVLALAHDSVRAVALASAVPGVLAVLTILFFVRDKVGGADSPESKPTAVLQDGPAAQPQASHPASTAPFSVDFRRYLAIVGLFSIGNASDVFLVAQALKSGISPTRTTLLWAALSLVRAVAATPGAVFAQRIGKRRSLAWGWMIYALCYVLFSQVHNIWTMLAVTVLYGTYYGLTEGAEKSLVAAYVHKSQLGRAYGLFAFVQGLSALVAGFLFALLYQVRDGTLAWWTCAALALAASLAMHYEAGRAAERERESTKAE
jgi:MFS family permease